MTIIIAKKYKDRIEIGCDSMVTSYRTHHIKEFKQNKIVTNGDDLAIGCAGCLAELGLFEFFVSTHLPQTNTKLGIYEYMHEFSKWKSDKGSKYPLENYYIIAFKHKLYSYMGDANIAYEHDDYALIGSGSLHAQSLMHIGYNVKDALDIVCELDPYCGHDKLIYTVKKPKKDKQK